MGLRDESISEAVGLRGVIDSAGGFDDRYVAFSAGITCRRKGLVFLTCVTKDSY